ncbi:MAG: SRPBCC family protein [Verrucomicrobiota bacterium]|nr:SRPBCC family protein [Verrucomicrobiota bacterium]
MTLHIDTDRIRKEAHLKAPRSRVWGALTDHREFSEWFGVKLESPFAVRTTTKGHMTIPGYEHIRFEATVQKLEPETYFSYTWHPYAIDPDVDYANETPTLVEFNLEEKDGGTLLTVIESGFAKLPAHRRDEAFRMNDDGWAQQLKDIEEHVTRAS